MEILCSQPFDYCIYKKIKCNIETNETDWQNNNYAYVNHFNNSAHF